MASIRLLVETALKTVIDAAATGATVYQGFGASDKAVPAVIVKARKATEDPYQSGNYRVLVDIQIKAVPDTDGTFDALCLAVRNVTWTDGMVASLQAAQTGFTVFGMSAPHEVEWSEEGDLWVETSNLEIYCAAY